ncbi:MAG: hypothetical protein II336_15440 [Loktanella sp.]|nr:hypothetical protein [Loktanella sp.]
MTSTVPDFALTGVVRENLFADRSAKSGAGGGRNPRRLCQAEAETVGSLADHRDVLKRALDILIDPV